MTVMIGLFFGMPQAVIRRRLWARMKPGEKDLYTYLLYESERCSTRELIRTDTQIRAAVDLASRTACNARKKLQELGLIRYERSAGNRYLYTICNPETGDAYPGGPREKIPYIKRSRQIQTAAPTSSKKVETPENHGIPLAFSKR